MFYKPNYKIGLIHEMLKSLNQEKPSLSERWSAFKLKGDQDS